jgi:AcrR family transcriptional regulator
MLEAPSGTPPTRRTGGRSARVRAAVLDVTIEILLTGRIEELTVSKVAARSGVHETTIYRRWQSPGNLAVDAFLSRVESQIPDPDSGQLRQDVLCLARDVATFVATPLGRVMLQLALRTDLPDLSAMRERFWENRKELGQRILQRAVERGEAGPDLDLCVAFEMLIAPIHVRTLLTRLPVDEQFLATVVDQLLAGIAVPAQETGNTAPSPSPSR